MAPVCVLSMWIFRISNAQNRTPSLRMRAINAELFGNPAPFCVQFIAHRRILGVKALDRLEQIENKCIQSETKNVLNT